MIAIKITVSKQKVKMTVDCLDYYGETAAKVKTHHIFWSFESQVQEHGTYFLLSQ